MPYLDHAGATLPSERQMKEVAEFLQRQKLSNPHSHHSTSIVTKQIVDNARQRILSHFNAEKDYTVIFTSNTTHSLKLVAECFDFPPKERLSCEIVDHLEKGPSFGYLADSHHSVVGMRETVREKVDFVSCLKDFEAFEEEIPESEGSLFVLTAMSNFCGYKYDLDVIQKLQKKGWSVCLDVAGLVSSSFFDLSRFRPDFVALSFYKIFGYPTGLGCLIVKNESAKKLKKRFFGGGGVNAVLPDRFTFVYRDSIEEKFEDGTLNYYGIASLQKGFDDLERYGGMEKIQEHSCQLADEAYKMLKNKFHWNGQPAIRIYRRGQKREEQGPVVAFNILQEDETYVGYAEVAKMADLFGLDLRTGCFCNIGACQRYLSLTDEDILSHIQSGKHCGDEQDLIDGKPTGAVRISFGRMSTFQDIRALEQMIDYCFLGQRSSTFHEHPVNLQDYSPYLSKIYCYPVKSCRGFAVSSSLLKKTGLKNDRRFMIVQNEMTMSQKRYPQLCRISTEILEEILILSSEGHQELRIPLCNSPEMNGIGKIVCSDSVSTVDCGEECASWLSGVLEFSGCRLQMAAQDSERSLSNQAPFLLINEASAQAMAAQTGLALDDVVARFRPNLLLRGMPPFIEDTMKLFKIGGIEFEVTGKCSRCEMICVDQKTGEKNPQLIVALRDLRDRQKMTFGVYVRQVEQQEEKAEEIHEGDAITILDEENTINKS